MPSLLHMSHRALKLNVYAAPSPATDRIVRLVFIEGSFLSNAMEARCCIAPKDCMQKDDVLTYVRPKPLLHRVDVPYARLLLCSPLVQGKRRGRAILSLRGGSKENQNVCVITYKHSVTALSRLHGLLYDKEVSISRRMVRLTVLLR